MGGLVEDKVTLADLQPVPAQLHGYVQRPATSASTN